MSARERKRKCVFIFTLWTIWRMFRKNHRKEMKPERCLQSSYRLHRMHNFFLTSQKLASNTRKKNYEISSTKKIPIFYFIWSFSIVFLLLLILLRLLHTLSICWVTCHWMAIHKRYECIEECVGRASTYDMLTLILIGSWFYYFIFSFKLHFRLDKYDFLCAQTYLR